MIAANLEAKIREVEMGGNPGYDYGFTNDPRQLKAQSKLERKQAQLDARFQKKMEELTLKTAIEQHRLD